MFFPAFLAMPSPRMSNRCMNLRALDALPIAAGDLWPRPLNSSRVPFPEWNYSRLGCVSTEYRVR